VVLGILAAYPAAMRWDRAVTIWLQRAAPAPDVPATIFVFLANAEVLISAAALWGVLLFARGNRGRGISAAYLAAALACVSAAAFGLKFLIVHAGPPDALVRPGPIIGWVNVPQPYSYPSGHTARTTFLAGTLFRGRPVLAAALVFLMMAALVYLGDHWTSDVLGGLCLGWLGVELARGAGAAGSTRVRPPNCPRG
jgi:membrane-associated phospholipid phosphatase